jgi:AcrR family transcriptional regulator
MDKKQKLLDAALRLFVEYGFYDTPTSRIAKEAGIANGTLFYFFPTKEDLIKSLYIQIKSEMSAYIYSQIDTGTSLKSIMNTYYSAALIWSLQHPLEFQFMGQFNSSPYIKKIASSEQEKYSRPVLELIETGIREKIFKPIDIEIIHLLIIAHTMSINQYLVSRNLSSEVQQRIINETFELLWDMIT